MVAQTTMPLRDPATGTAIDPQFDAGDPTSAPSERTRALRARVLATDVVSRE